MRLARPGPVLQKTCQKLPPKRTFSDDEDSSDELSTALRPLKKSVRRSHCDDDEEPLAKTSDESEESIEGRSPTPSWSSPRASEEYVPKGAVLSMANPRGRRSLRQRLAVGGINANLSRVSFSSYFSKIREARQNFKHDLPDFVFRNSTQTATRQGKRFDREVRLADERGEVKKSRGKPIQITIQSREWDLHNSFWTTRHEQVGLDRVILREFYVNTSGLIHYKIWRGSSFKYDEPPDLLYIPHDSTLETKKIVQELTGKRTAREETVYANDQSNSDAEDEEVFDTVEVLRERFQARQILTLKPHQDSFGTQVCESEGIAVMGGNHPRGGQKQDLVRYPEILSHSHIN